MNVQAPQNAIYVDQASFHYQPEFSHVMTYELGGGKLVSMFIDDDFKCVVETRAYDSDYSKCQINQSRKKMSVERAKQIMNKFLN